MERTTAHPPSGAPAAIGAGVASPPPRVHTVAVSHGARRSGPEGPDAA